jgi:hypothetical protein
MRAMRRSALLALWLAAGPGCAASLMRQYRPEDLQAGRDVPPIPGEVANIVLVGDSGTRAGAAMAAGSSAVAAHARGSCRELGGCQAVLLLGDNLYPAGIPRRKRAAERARAFFAEQSRRWSEIGPQLYALGNHDWGQVSRARARRELALVRELEPMGAWGGRPFYDVEVGPVRVVVLDTWYLANKCRVGKDRPWTCDDGALDQGLEDMLRRPAGVQWQVVAGHVAWYSRGAHRDLGRTPRAELADRGVGLTALIEAQVAGQSDAWLAAHDHHLELFATDPALRGTAAIVSGAGAKRRRVDDLPPAEQAGRWPAHDWDSVCGAGPDVMAPCREELSPLGYFVLSATPDELRLRAHTLTGGQQVTAVKRRGETTWTVD